MSAANRFLVVGGGVAGVTCAEELCSLNPSYRVTLVSSSSSARGVSNFLKLSHALETFDVIDVALSSLQDTHENLQCIIGVISRVDLAAKVAYLSDGRSVPFDRMCVCTGAEPKKIFASPLVMCIRDTEHCFPVDPQTVSNLVEKLASARRAVIVGNGGIALSIVHEVRSIDLVWTVKDAYIGNTFFDASASAFFLEATRREIFSLNQDTLADVKPTATWHWRAVQRDFAFNPVGLTRSLSCTGDVLPKLSQIFPKEEIPASMDAADIAMPVRDKGRRWKRAKLHHSTAPPGSDSCGFTLPPKEQETRIGSVMKPHGSALGPGLVDTLRGLRGLSCAKAATVSASLRCDPDHGHDSIPVHSCDSDTSSHPLFLEMSTEVIALRFRGSTTWDLVEPSSTLPLTMCSDLEHHLQEFVMGDAEIADPEWPVYVLLSNGHVIGCDFIVSAIGVDPASPNKEWLAGPSFQRESDGGLIVNRKMQTTGHPDVFAAGDAASVIWPEAVVTATPEGQLDLDDPHARRPMWHQMRLWNAARTTGSYAARCMADAVDPLDADGCGCNFELFAHVTRLLGFKVVLLGLYNGQGLGAAYEDAMKKLVITPSGLVGATAVSANTGPSSSASIAGPSQPTTSTAATSGSTIDSGNAPAQPPVQVACDKVQILVRVTPGVEYVKVVVLHGCVVGAIVVGDTDLEETLENLILNRLNVSGIDLLHPDADLEGFFD